ncbi:VOC family protein [Micromonospora sp. R77]|uniref:VOC family protein n=1 Tax=Micromonospora sp. R77 TaxID=2925836 RepID=UPI001F602D94|nr:VOC family protein [Micromonospora sp. R77]MCI4064961.1 VOC family protein [Micromonospora sp. R77]
MSALIHCVTVESADPYVLAGWWATVLDRRLHDDDHPGDPEAVLVAPDGHGPDLLFVTVDERHGKGAFHLDLHPADGTRDAEVDRLLGLGATLVADRRRPDGTGWVVLADPEGNEFCVCRGPAERAA